MGVPMAVVPPHERPRERLLRLGPDALTDRELLALVLRSGSAGESALDLAASLLAEFGDLDALARALPEELASRRGVGPAKAALVIAALNLARRAEAGLAPTMLRGPADVALVAQRELHGARRERVLVLVGNGANRLVRTVAVSEGSIDRSLVPVREILNAVLRHDGRAFALVHNHPGGNPEPSEADRRATEEVRAGAKAAGLRFLCHVVVTDTDWREVS